MKNILSTLLIALIFCQFSIAQNLISHEKVGSKSLAEMINDYSFLIQTGVDHYRVLYTTKDIEGVVDTASGLISVPIDKGFLYPVCIHQHGTVDGREDVPSNLAGGYQIGEVAAGFNMVTISPDYIGLGTSRGQHPYIHAESESWAAIDMYKALDDFLDQTGYSRNNQIFITGYSQGGHGSMAVQKSLETELSDQYKVTAASHMSGPYSVSEKMIEFTLSDNEYFFSAYLANVTLSMKAAYPELLDEYEVSEIFKAQYLPAINQFVNEEIGLFQLNDIMESMLLNEVGSIVPKNMLHDSIVEALTTNPDHPISQTLALQDVYDWAPEAPTRIYYCEADDQVWFENGVLAGEVMNANGATDVVTVPLDPEADHVECVNPAVTSTMLFFLQYTEVLSGVNDSHISKDYRLSNTTAFDNLVLHKESSAPIGDRFMILNMQGKPVSRGTSIVGDETNISVTDLPSGQYVIMIRESKTILRFTKI